MVVTKKIGASTLGGGHTVDITGEVGRQSGRRASAAA